jgi:hypothetical protein
MEAMQSLLPAVCSSPEPYKTSSFSRTKLSREIGARLLKSQIRRLCPSATKKRGKNLALFKRAKRWSNGASTLRTKKNGRFMKPSIRARVSRSTVTKFDCQFRVTWVSICDGDENCSRGIRGQSELWASNDAGCSMACEGVGKTPDDDPELVSPSGRYA